MTNDTNNKYNITVVMPIHRLSGENELRMAKAAAKSLVNQKSDRPKVLKIVHTAEVSSDSLNEISKHVKSLGKDSLEVEFLRKSTGGSDFQSMVNAAVQDVTTPYFSVLEFDDEYTDIYFGYVAKYLKAYPKANMLLPIVAETDLKGQLLKYSNEVPWVQDFSAVQGTLDHAGLLDFAGVNLTGAVIKTSDFINAGSLKPNLPVVFNYEFLLRFTLDEDIQVISIPKIGYLHKNGRENSLFTTYMTGENQLTSKELKFWFDTAKTECQHKEDRKVTYNPSKA